MDMHREQKGSNARKHSALSLALADEVRAEMGVTRMTARALSKASGIPERTLARLVSGERSIDVAQLDMISRAFGLSMATLLQRAEARAAAEGEAGESAKVAGQ